MSTPPGPSVPPESYPSVPPEAHPQVPTTGYQLPPAYGQYALPFHPGPYDPLVPEPGSAFDGWWSRVLAVFRANVGMLVVIFLLLSGLPSVLFSVALLATGAMSSLISYDEQGIPHIDTELVPALFCGIFTFVLISSFLSALGWAAGIQAVTARAAGQQVTIGNALRAGLRRAAPLWGWYLLAGLITTVGVCACVLPVFYLGFAVSLFSFPVIFERGRNPIGRSFSLIHANFGPALGRVALLAGIYAGVALAVSLGGTVLVAVISGGSGPSSLPQPGQTVTGAGIAAQIVSSVIQGAVGLPLSAFLLVGLMITYTQLRRIEEPITTQQLWADATGLTRTF
jgi:hypothetical protein